MLFTFFSNSCTFQKMFYFPEKIAPTDTLFEGLNYENIYIKSSNENKINAAFFKPKGTVIGTILLLHGNAGNISDYTQMARLFSQNGFQLLIIDYQGFGRSEGKPSHDALIDDATAALNYLTKREDVKNTKIIVLGLSIGGHLAVTITKQNQDKIAAMVIEGAFTSHNNIATTAMPWFIKPIAKVFVRSKYKATKNIKEISIPKLIIHSTEDEIIPFWMGKELFSKAIEPKTFWEIKGSHIQGSSLYDKEYVEKIKQLISNTK